jgi:hypothetical protein
MAYVAADWSIDRSNGNIRYIGDDHGGASPSYATVIEAHRAWQALADDLTSSGNDELDITDTNPSARSTDNIITLLGNYNIDDNAAEHLYNGSITQGGGDVIYAGFVNFGNTSSICWAIISRWTDLSSGTLGSLTKSLKVFDSLAKISISPIEDSFIPVSISISLV